MLGEMFKSILKFFIIGIIVFAFLIFNLSNSYPSNTFKVTINGDEIYVRYYEKYYRGIPFILGTLGGISDTDNEVEPVVNNIPMNSQMLLTIEEYQVFLVNTNNRSYNNKRWVFNKEKYTYEKQALSPTKLTIKRKGKTIYDGKYIQNISKYVDEPGRYFFQAEVTRKDNFYTTVKTFMSFNIIVGGGNIE